nr:ribonuclease P protein component [Maliibacterium massiliense]
MNKAYRLRKNCDYQRVYRRGKSAATPLLALVWMPRGGRELKCGFSVSKKIGNAVVRNRTRRRIREAVRLQIPAMRTGVHMIFIARKPAADAPYHKIDKAVRYLLRRCKLYRELPCGAAGATGAPGAKETRPS